MAREERSKRGDTNGDTRAAKTKDSTPRRRQRVPRKTKAPACVEGLEHRWVRTTGWRFRARMKVDGKLLTGSWGTKDDAIAERDQMRARVEAAGDGPIVTFEEAAQAVLDTVKNEGTWRSYEEHFLVLGEHFGADTPLAEITPDDIRAFLAWRRATRTRGKPPSEGRLRKHLTALTRVFNLATKKGIYSGVNPVDRVEKPRAERTKPDVFTIDEVREVLTAADGWDRAILAALFFSGLRRSELARVKVEQIDRKSGLIRDVQGKTGPRNVLVTKPLAVALDDLVEHEADGFLIPAGVRRGPRKDGNRPSTPHDRRVAAIQRAMVRIRDRVREHLGARLRAHTMRHSLKTFLADNDVPVHVRDEILGHRPAGVARGYEHASIMTMRHHAHRVLDPLLSMVVSDTADVGT